MLEGGAHKFIWCLEMEKTVFHHDHSRSVKRNYVVHTQKVVHRSEAFRQHQADGHSFDCSAHRISLGLDFPRCRMLSIDLRAPHLMLPVRAPLFGCKNDRTAGLVTASDEQVERYSSGMAKRKGRPCNAEKLPPVVHPGVCVCVSRCVPLCSWCGCQHAWNHARHVHD